jgi:hypothetical protein
MCRLLLASLALSLASAIGCKDETATKGAVADQMTQKPTEDEVRKAVLRLAAGRKITLLSPVYEAPDLFFTKSNEPVDPAAVACYVAFTSEPKSKDETAGIETMLIVVGRDSGNRNAKDRGAIRLYQPMTYPVPEYMGADWFAKHPWPKSDAKK